MAIFYSTITITITITITYFNYTLITTVDNTYVTMFTPSLWPSERWTSLAPAAAWRAEKLGDFHFDLLEWFRNSKIWVEIWIKISRRKSFDTKKMVGKEKHTLIFHWKNNDDLVENHGWWAYLSHDQFSYFWTKMVYYNTYQTTNVTEVTFKVWYLILWGSTKVVSLEGYQAGWPLSISNKAIGWKKVMKISQKIWKCHKFQQNLFWLSRGSMLIFTTFQQQKKGHPLPQFSWQVLLLEQLHHRSGGGSQHVSSKEKCSDGIKIRNIGKIFILILKTDLMVIIYMGMGQNPGTFCSPQVIAGLKWMFIPL